MAVWAAAVVLPVAAGAVAPSPAAAATTLEVDAGYAGTYVPGEPLPVRVRIAADRLLAAEVQVAADGAPMSVAVEVPGGSQKEFLVIVPTGERAAPLSVSARVADGSKTPPVATTSVAPLSDAEIVGLLPGALAGRALPGPTTLAVDVGTARFVALGPSELDRAPESLYALRTIAVGGDELARQAPAVRNGLLRWTERGGRLLLDTSPGTPVPGLPDEWQPGARGRALVGTGEIRLTAGAMAAGRWAGLVEPTSRSSESDFREVNGPPLGDSLARDAGFRLPQLSWLVAFLAVYVFVVGPGLYLLLRRRRRPELAWAVIPLVAILFTVASWAGGRGLRNSTSAVHGTVLATGANGSTAVTWLGLSSRSGDSIRLRYPEGWLTGGSDRGVAQLSQVSSVRMTPSGPEATLPLDAGQFGVVSARGPSGVPGSVAVTARSVADGQVSGTIRNDTDLSLDGAAVFVGSNAVSVGLLQPGEQKDWSVQVFQDGGPPAEFRIWGPDRVSRDGVPSFTNVSLFDVAKRSGLVPRDPGSAVGVGWTRDYRPPVEMSGGGKVRPDGQTLVVGTAPVTTGAGRAVDVSVRRETVRTTGTLPSGFRFTLPDTGRTPEPAKLMLRSPAFPLDVWTGEGWTSLNCTPPACQQDAGFVDPPANCPPGVPCAPPGAILRRGPGGPSGDVALPAGAVRDGVVYVRLNSGLPPFFVESGLSLREVS